MIFLIIHIFILQLSYIYYNWHSDIVITSLQKKRYLKYCELKTRTLISYANPWTQPRLIDSFYYVGNKTTTIIIILSYSYLKIMYPNNTISLYYEGHYYVSKYSKLRFLNVLLLRYDIPKTNIYGGFDLTLYDNNFKTILFRKLPICYRIIEKANKVVICTHISSYNSVNEIINWIGFHLIQGIDMIIIYISQRIDNITSLLNKEISEGKVILVDFLWPVGKGLIQRKYQSETMTSCYYRYRHIASTFLFFDVDEYAFSREYPFSLYKATRELWKDGKNHAHIISHFYYSENKYINREDVFKKGDLFTTHTYVAVPPDKGHRRKNVVSSSFEGQIRQHWVTGNTNSKMADPNIIQIAHFKKPSGENNPQLNITREDKYLNIYTTKLKEFWSRRQ